ncbi:hypothetical protein [Hyalangium sp.]|uniref:hypothetical protein n=1 Tax=Hyalangium sp. TaxID=2028555 RepID=UPI002D331D95|nr:hypothetical protein [Hyalangium sp.]HYH98366.1 hypothetical protein [Hyalangium sp.]
MIREGELQECLVPTCSQKFEVPPVEVLGARDGSRDGFDSGSERFRDGFEAESKRRPVELNPLDQDRALEFRRAAEVAEQAFSLLGRVELRA